MSPQKYKLTAIIILVAAAVTAIIAVPTCKHKMSSAPIKIGAILPLTGDAAEYGNNDREGILLAIKAVNDSGGVDGHKVEVLFEDCQMDAKLAVSAFSKLRLQGVSAIIDDAISTISLALVPLLEPQKTVLISTGSSNPALSGASPYFFRIWNSDAFEGSVSAEYIRAKYPTGTVAIFYINSDYGSGLERVMRQRLAGSGVRVVATETFETDARDFRAQVAKIAQESPDCIYLVGYAAQTGPAVRQLKEGGVDAQVIGTVAMQDPEFVKLAGAASEGVVYPFPDAPSGTAVDSFKKAFVDTYGKEPGLLNDCGYDAANLLIDAMRKNGTAGEEVRDALAQVKDYPGASGVITFDNNGDVSKPMIMKVIRSGSFVDLK